MTDFGSLPKGLIEGLAASIDSGQTRTLNTHCRQKSELKTCRQFLPRRSKGAGTFPKHARPMGTALWCAGAIPQFLENPERQASDFAPRGGRGEKK
jgi:hypothetical protein